MKREKKIIVVCHCLLNCNSKVEGLSVFGGAHEVVRRIISEGYGLIQLPCPEMIMYGIKRWGHVKNQFDTPFFKSQCRLMLTQYIQQFKDYIENGYSIPSIIAVNYSPSCGYDKTCISEQCGGNSKETGEYNVESVNEKGVFIEVLENMLKEENLDIKIIGLDEKSYDDTFEFM